MRAATIKRREAWSERSSSEWDRDRQRVSRLKRAVKPREPASSPDPWELAYEALQLLRTVRTAVKKADQLDRLERVAEAVRRLAYGPDEPAKPAEPERDSKPPESEGLPWTGWDGSWRREHSA